MKMPAALEKPVVSVVIITRNTRDLVLGLLGSLHEAEDLLERTREVIVIDNGSSDGTVESIGTEYPRAVVVRNERNVGFAGAVNQAWRRAEGELIFLLNSDTRVMPGQIRPLLDFMEQNPKVAVAGPSLVYEDMRPQRSFSSVPSLLQQVVPKFMLELFSPARYGGKTWGSPNPEHVESLIGAALIIRRSALKALDGFDERFFFFLEETDFCLRARQLGWQVVLFPSTRIVHYQGRTVGANWVKGRIEYNISLDKFIGKHHGKVYHFVFRSVRSIKSFLTLAGSTTLMPALIFSRPSRRRYRYYLAMTVWYLRGCPERGGLRS